MPREIVEFKNPQLSRKINKYYVPVKSKNWRDTTRYLHTDGTIRAYTYADFTVYFSNTEEALAAIRRYNNPTIDLRGVYGA